MTTLNPPSPVGSLAAGLSQGLDGDGLRHELVDAQVQLLSSYLDKRSPEQLLGALVRLVDCCRASFREEEALMIRLCGQMDGVHRARHEAVMKQLEELRLTALNSDRGRLLGSLILIDRELIAHVADAARGRSGTYEPAPSNAAQQVEAHH